MRYRICSLLTLLWLASCGAPEELQNYSARNLSSSQSAPSQWNASAFPLELAISSDFSQEDQNAVLEMSSKWTTASKISTEYFDLNSPKAKAQGSVSTEIKNLDDYNDNIMGIYKITSWYPELPPTALAVTQIYGSNLGNKIIIEHADILINYENFEFSSAGGFGYDLKTVVLHELGHFLGLYHEYNLPDESVMYPSIGRFDIRREPLDHDIKNIQDKYEFTTANQQNSQIDNQLQEQNDKVPVVIRLELNAKGKCTHKINGKVFREH